MSSKFIVKEHVLESQHIREYARATSEAQEDVLKLAVKQYTPLDNLHPKEGDVTIIGAHANGFPKELYEPLWEDILSRSHRNGFRIRSIWIADVAWQGVSGVLNERILGDEPSWHDHARDLLHMINHFRSEMPMPLVGIGHSFGGAVLCNLSLMHPRLLSTIVFLDPVIQTHAYSPDGPNPAGKSAFRKDFWSSRADAEATFKKNRFYQSWDPRVLDKWCEFGLRETPSGSFSEQGVTLTTTKHQECFTFLRPGWEAFSEDGKQLLHRDMVPDIPVEGIDALGFYRPEAPNLLAQLGHLRASALYIFGEVSPMSGPDSRKIKMEITGTETGGSGGAKLGRVKEVVLDGIGHLVAMDATTRCAEAAASWLGHELRRAENAAMLYRQWAAKPLAEKQTLSKDWKDRIRASPQTFTSNSSKL